MRSSEKRELHPKGLGYFTGNASRRLCWLHLLLGSIAVGRQAAVLTLVELTLCLQKPGPEASLGCLCPET